MAFDEALLTKPFFDEALLTKPLDEALLTKQARVMFQQLVSGVEYCHQHAVGTLTPTPTLTQP